MLEEFLKRSPLFISRIIFKDLTGTVLKNISAVEKQIEEINRNKEILINDIVKFSDSLDKIKLYYDSLLIKRDKSRVRERILKTQKTFYIDGWVIKSEALRIEKLLLSFDCVVMISDPDDGEEYPILLKNNSFSTAHESITELYSLPYYKNLAPTAFLAPFYCVFFGIMLSDAGYGLILTLGCLFILRKFRLEGFIKKLIKTLMFGGISTIFWGAMFGSWFGDVVSVVGKLFFGKTISVAPIWFNPVEDPMKLFIFSFILGGIHMFLGMGLKAYMMIRDGDLKGAIFDIGSWYLVFIGIIFMIFGEMNVGGVILIIGVLMLILTQGRHQKNIFMKLFSGVSSLYNITGYLSDLMSYSRLLALGLATGVIASVVNTMGSLGGGGIIGAIVLTIVFIVGHIFNLGINTLGTFVHASRLQYVEFFGKFYEGGGTAFEPFFKNTKYHHILVKEEK